MSIPENGSLFDLLSTVAYFPMIISILFLLTNKILWAHVRPKKCQAHKNLFNRPLLLNCHLELLALLLLYFKFDTFSFS